MSCNAWETTSPTSLHAITYILIAMLLYSLLHLTTTSETSTPKRYCLFDGNTKIMKYDL